MDNIDAIIHHLTQQSPKLSIGEAGNLVGKHRGFVNQELGKYTHHSRIASLLLVREGFGS